MMIQLVRVIRGDVGADAGAFSVHSSKSVPQSSLHARSVNFRPSFRWSTHHLEALRSQARRVRWSRRTRGTLLPPRAELETIGEILHPRLWAVRCLEQTTTMAPSGVLPQVSATPHMEGAKSRACARIHRRVATDHHPTPELARCRSRGARAHARIFIFLGISAADINIRAQARPARRPPFKRRSQVLDVPEEVEAAPTR